MRDFFTVLPFIFGAIAIMISGPTVIFGSIVWIAAMIGFLFFLDWLIHGKRGE